MNTNKDNLEFGPGSFSGNSAKAEAGANRIKIPADQYFSISNGDPTTLSVDAVFDTYAIEVTDPSTFSVGDSALILTAISSYSGTVLVIAGNVIILDSLLNFSYPAGTFIQSRAREMNVDGSVTPVKFEIFLPAGILPDAINVSRLMMSCLTSGTVDLSKFGDIVGGITRGILLRGVPNPSVGLPPTNQWNAKTNNDLGILAYDINISSAQNPQQGQNGFLWRYTYGGKDKHDIIPPISVGDKLELIVQDNLLTILSLKILYGGNFEVIT